MQPEGDQRSEISKLLTGGSVARKRSRNSEIKRLGWGRSNLRQLSGAGPVWASIRKISKLNTKSPPPGGRSKVCSSQLTGPAPLSRADFFSTREFFRASQTKFASPFNARGTRERYLFPHAGPPGGGQKSGTFRSGTGGQARKNRREIRKNIFLQHCHQPEWKKLPRNSGWGG
jgi:hypothetical protein